MPVAGKHIAFMEEIVKAAQKISPAPVDIDMLGATGATLLNIGFSPEATWMIWAISRAFAAGAHYCEEKEREEPMRLGQSLLSKKDSVISR